MEGARAARGCIRDVRARSRWIRRPGEDEGSVAGDRLQLRLSGSTAQAEAPLKKRPSDEGRFPFPASRYSPAAFLCRVRATRDFFFFPRWMGTMSASAATSGTHSDG